jgi:hypothetical protein
VSLSLRSRTLLTMQPGPGRRYRVCPGPVNRSGVRIAYLSGTVISPLTIFAL